MKVDGTIEKYKSGLILKGFKQQGLDYFDHSFETRTGPAGRPWTRPTRA
jgi:hypothetical protein